MEPEKKPASMVDDVGIDSRGSHREPAVTLVETTKTFDSPKPWL